MKRRKKKKSPLPLNWTVCTVGRRRPMPVAEARHEGRGSGRRAPSAVKVVSRHQQLERVLWFNGESGEMALVIRVLDLVVKVLDGLLEDPRADLGEFHLPLRRLLILSCEGGHAASTRLFSGMAGRVGAGSRRTHRVQRAWT